MIILLFYAFFVIFFGNVELTFFTLYHFKYNLVSSIMSGAGNKRSGDDRFSWVAKILKASNDETIEESKKRRQESYERRRAFARSQHRCSGKSCLLKPNLKSYKINSACQQAGHFEFECSQHMPPEVWIDVCNRRALCVVCLK